MKVLFQDTLALIFDIITEPQRTMRVVTGEAHLYEGLLAWGFTLFLPCISAMLQLGRFSASVLLGAIVGGIVLFVIEVVFVHGTAGLFGGQGKIKGLASGICFSNVPICFATLAESLVFVLPAGIIHTISLAAVAWAIILAVLAVKTNYGLGTGRSIVALFLPVVLLIGIFVVLAVYFVYSIVSLVQGF